MTKNISVARLRHQIRRLFRTRDLYSVRPLLLPRRALGFATCSTSCGSYHVRMSSVNEVPCFSQYRFTIFLSQTSTFRMTGIRKFHSHACANRGTLLQSAQAAQMQGLPTKAFKCGAHPSTDAAMEGWWRDVDSWSS